MARLEVVLSLFSVLRSHQTAKQFSTLTSPVLFFLKNSLRMPCTRDGDSMRPSLILCFLALSSITQVPSAAGQAPPVRDPDALAVVQSAITALGGQDAIGQVQTCLAQVQTQAEPGSTATSTTATWKNMGNEFRYEVPAGEIFVSGHGTPAFSIGGTVKLLPSYVGLASFPSAMVSTSLLSQFLNPSYSVMSAGNGTVGSNPAVLVKTNLSTDTTSATVTQQTWYFDPTSGVPLRAEYQVPDWNDATVSGAAAVEFADYTAVSGVKVPYKITYFFGGKPLQTATLTAVVFNSGVTTTDFDVPSGDGQ